MPISNSIIDTIGNTPLIKLRRASEITGCTILGKAEFLNPGQSVKDRAALNIVRAAEARGALAPGGHIVEGTAGNTGIGLCVVGKALGYQVTIVMPRTQSQEKKDAIRLLGGNLVEVDALPYNNPGNYIRYSEQLAKTLAQKEQASVLWANQFDNVDNREAHRTGTALEIWDQTDAQLDGFICAVGTGGTIGGMSLGLKEKNSNIVVAIADPLGSKMFSWVKEDKLTSHGNSITEGIGQGRITANLEDIKIDTAYQISDTEALEILFSLIEEEALCLGGSSGINVAGAIHLAKEMGPGKTIVTMLCDYGNRYQSKIYNPEFLREKDLPVPDWLS